MKRVIGGIALALALSGVATGGAHVAHADGSMMNGATVTQTCANNITAALGFGPFIVTSACDHETQTPSGDANRSAHGEVSNPPSQTVVANNFLCFTSYGGTTDSHLVVTSSGQFSFECHYHANS